MQRNDDALELLTTKWDKNAAAYNWVAEASALDRIGEDAVHGHGQRDVTKKRHKECLHEEGRRHGFGEIRRCRNGDANPEDLRTAKDDCA